MKDLTMSSLIFNHKVFLRLSVQEHGAMFGGSVTDATHIPPPFSPISMEKYYASVHDYDFCMSISATAGILLLQ